MTKLGNEFSIIHNGVTYHYPFPPSVDSLYNDYMEIGKHAKDIYVNKICNGGSFQYFGHDTYMKYLTLFHRTDGHAYEDVNGKIAFMVNGSVFSNTNDYCEAANIHHEQHLYMYLRYGDTLPYRIEDL